MKNNLQEKNKITIVTVVFNGEKEIENTILSVLNQDYNNFEYIVIDGNSTDNTMTIIEKYSDKITKVISEYDEGIYDAMNKGIEHATGEWVNFMNCGDVFYDKNVLTKLFNFKLDADIIYGDNLLKYSWGNVLLAPDSIHNLNKYMTFGHQTTFVKKEILCNFKFNLNFKISADYDLFYRLYKKGYIFKYIPLIISVFSAEDGISSNNPLITFIEDAKVRGDYNSLKWKIKFSIFYIKFIIKQSLIRFLPAKFVAEKRKKNIFENPLIKKIYID